MSEGGQASPLQRRKKEYSYQHFAAKIKDHRAIDIMQVMQRFVRLLDSQLSQPETKQSKKLKDIAAVVHAFVSDVHQLVKIHELWKLADEEELQNAQESVEKFVSSKLYSKLLWYDDDIKVRNDVLQEKIICLGFVEPPMLDLPIQSKFLAAHQAFQQAKLEITSIDKFKAAKDKLVCLLNTCNLLLGLLKAAASDVRSDVRGGNSFGADEFLPLLIYTVIQARPKNIVANLEFIAAIRHPSTFSSEYRYYHSSLVGAVAYIESIGAEDLKMDQAEFDTRMADVRVESESKNDNGRASQSPSGQPELGVRFAKVKLAKLTVADLGPLLAEYKAMGEILRKQRHTQTTV
jgi:hypothetical protein